MENSEPAGLENIEENSFLSEKIEEVSSPYKETFTKKLVKSYSNEMETNSALIKKKVNEPPQQVQQINIRHIQHSLKTVIDLISKCQTRNSIELLSQIMDAIATNCEALELSPDDKQTNFDRLHFWNGLNDTWLFAIQCAPNFVTLDQEMLEDDWIALRDSVVAWSDVLEWYGLVDYQMGLWEEDIIEAIQANISQIKLRK